ncbi:MAG: S41 family peptidase [Ferruginibacter sp.]
MENKRLKIWLPLLLSITMIAGMYLGYKMRDGIQGKSFFFMEKRRPLQEIMDLIKNRYVDDVNLDTLAGPAIEALLGKLDPHSTYIPAEELADVNEDIQGSFYGIGIEFNVFDDSLHVINVLKDGPSYIAGLKTGDKILKAGDSILSGNKVKTENIRRLLRGPLGSEVNLRILRGNKIVSITVKRGIIPVSSVDASYMLDSITGYLRLNKFTTQTYREFMVSLTDLKKKGLIKLILDLRGNGGGVLDEAVEIADEFLDGDKLVTYTEGKHVKKKEYRCRRLGQFEKGALVILADEGSASASEILMGALQDWDRATIVGRRSFGKGLVQEQYDLSDKSALRLTIARYYTPLGRSIQRSYAHGGKEYYDEISRRFATGYTDSLRSDSMNRFTSPAGKKLYGGGGITPDYNVDGDTGRIGAITARLYTKGLLGNFGYKYIISNSSFTDLYKTPVDYVRSFKITEDNWKFFESLAAKDSINLSGITEAEKKFLYNSLKTSIARQVFRNEGYYEAINVDDNYVKKALELLKVSK